jgi:alpha-mannosidase
MPQQQLSRCDRVMQQRLEPHIHTVLSSCALRAFDNPGEPEPSGRFLQRVREGNVDFRPFVIPGMWGTTWGTTWFEVSGQIDLQAAQRHTVELVVDLGWLAHRGPGFQAEGMAYRLDGTAIKSANPRNSWIPLISEHGERACDIDADGRFTIYIEAAANPFVEGPTPYSPTELGERATGKPDEPYTCSRVDVCVLNREAYEYYMDLDTIGSLMRELRDDDPRFWQLAKALQRSLNDYDERDQATLTQARAQLAAVLAEPAASSVIRHVAVGHAHIDSAWLWPVRETRRKVARTVSNVLALMDEDEDFKYAMSSAQQYAWLEEDHPDLFARMKERIAEGRFIPVGGMWVESDGMIPTGESLIRQISFGKRYFRERLGVDPKGIWLPDSFGYTGAWPQIARRAGFEWFLTQKISWNDTTKFPHHSFLWEGIDGSRILTHFPPSDTYGAQMSMHELEYSQANFLDKDLSRNAIMLYGYGDGGGGPTREMNARIRRASDLDGAPRVEFGTPDELFARVRKDIVDDAQGEIATYQGELYLELHRATLTSQQEMKRGCRAEESMLRTVEYLCAAASIHDSDYVYPCKELDDIWKTLLLNQFHDILPGSAIAWVARQAREEYARDLERLRGIARQACEAISAANASVQPGGAARGARRVGTFPQAHILSSTTDPKDAWTVQPIGQLGSVTQRSEVPCSMAQRPETPGRQNKPTRIERLAGSTVLDNGLIRAVVEADGTVSSLTDLAKRRELVPAGARIGRYELLKDEPYNWDAWDIQRDAFLTACGIPGGETLGAQTEAGGSAWVRSAVSTESVRIETTVTLQPGSTSLDFTADVDWHAKERFLKVDLPIGIQARNAQYECQYGMIERPIQKNSPSEEAQYESCTHRFVRIADASYAAAIVNGSTYGSDVSPMQGWGGSGKSTRIEARGTMVRLSLLSAPLYPDPRTDQGEHHFAWSVLLDATMDAVLASAASINAPVLADVPDIAPLASVEAKSGSMVLDWVKMADDGSGDIILRMYEPAGGEARGVLHVCDELRGARIGETDLLEVELSGGNGPGTELPRALDAVDLQPLQAEGARISLMPFQLATLRLRR